MDGNFAGFSVEAIRAAVSDDRVAMILFGLSLVKISEVKSIKLPS
jgi:hypothetical protein